MAFRDGVMADVSLSYGKQDCMSDYVRISLSNGDHSVNVLFGKGLGGLGLIPPLKIEDVTSLECFRCRA